MASKPEKNKNWQLRQYDNFGPHFRIDTGNPQVGEDGATVWGFYGEDPDTKARCSLRQSSTGAFHIFNVMLSKSIYIFSLSYVCSACKSNEE